ncbi:MAG: phosphatidylserine/phosphatidylglycerophosphate/cardiolipin synthase family protein [bacterium]
MTENPRFNALVTLLTILALGLAPHASIASVIQPSSSDFSDTSDRDRSISKVRVLESVPNGTSLDHSNIPQTHQGWEKVLNRSDTEIVIGTFYMTNKDGSKQSKIIDLVRRKARNGVRVRVISDSGFFSTYPDVLRSLSGEPNTEVRVLNLSDRTGGVMHAKYMVVDSRYFYVGSANFAWKSLEHIREVGLAGNDPRVARKLLSVFDVDWLLSGRSDTTQWADWKSLQEQRSYGDLKEDTLPEERVTGGIMPVATPPKITPESVMPTREALIRMINTAEDEIFLDLYGYSVTNRYTDIYLDDLDRALRRASTRGVDVHVLVGEWGMEEPGQSFMKSLAPWPNITVKVISLPIDKEGYRSYSRVSHTKLMIVDGDYAWVGSANWKPGYFSESRNVGLVTTRWKPVSTLKRFFLTAWTGPYSASVQPGKQYSVPYHE